MIFIYPNTMSTFSGKRETAIKAGYVEITEQQYNDLCETKLKWQGKALVVDETYESRKQQELEQEEKRKENEKLRNEIAKLKEDIKKYKEDVEQVELFGMERADYETKKELCINIILKLRELEAKLE